MKTLSEYMRAPYRMEIEVDPSEGGYVASFPDLPGCLTFAETLEELIENVDDAKRTWFEDMLERKMPIQEPRRLEEYSGCFKLRMPRSLHKKLMERSKEEGISMNQYCIYLLSQNNALFKMDSNKIQ